MSQEAEEGDRFFTSNDNKIEEIGCDLEGEGGVRHFSSWTHLMLPSKVSKIYF